MSGSKKRKGAASQEDPADVLRRAAETSERNCLLISIVLTAQASPAAAAKVAKHRRWHGEDAVEAIIQSAELLTDAELRGLLVQLFAAESPAAARWWADRLGVTEQVLAQSYATAWAGVLASGSQKPS